MRVINGERIEVLTYKEYKDRFPTKEPCYMCPFRYKRVCDCGDNLYVKVSSDIIWR